jgi:hypothetical protein
MLTPFGVDGEVAMGFSPSGYTSAEPEDRRARLSSPPATGMMALHVEWART